MMHLIKKITLIAGLSSMTLHAFSQQKEKDNLSAFREMAKLRQLYDHPPVQLAIHISNTAEPVTNSMDTLQADMNLYYGQPDFYMETEGLEEIVNDSFVIMINNPVKQIMLYANNRQAVTAIRSSMSQFMPDSSIIYLKEKYTATVQNDKGTTKRIEFKSRELLKGTNFPKETITIVYRSSSHEYVEYNQQKYRLVPVDSTVYAGMANDAAYRDKLLMASTEKGNIFFLVKKLTTSCQFKSIRYDVHTSPAKQQDRIVKGQDGNYIPAKGFEEYVLSKQF